MLAWLKKMNRRKMTSPAESRRIAGVKKRITKAQHKIANHLSDWDSLLTTKERKIVLLLFFSAMFVLSGWMLYDGIFKKPEGAPGYLERQTITRPESTDLPDSLNIPLLEEKRLQQLEQQKMDSISQHK